MKLTEIKLKKILKNSPYSSPLVNVFLRENSIEIVGKVSTFFQKQMIGELFIGFVLNNNQKFIIKNKLLVT